MWGGGGGGQRICWFLLLKLLAGGLAPFVSMDMYYRIPTTGTLGRVFLQKQSQNGFFFGGVGLFYTGKPHQVHVYEEGFSFKNSHKMGECLGLF